MALNVYSELVIKKILYSEFFDVAEFVLDSKKNLKLLLLNLGNSKISDSQNIFKVQYYNI